MSSPTGPVPPPLAAHDVVEAAKSTLGVRYKYGGTSPETGFDCSGLVCWAYEQVGVQLPRRARDQLHAGVKVEQKADLKPGDIVVFKGTRSRSGWHSGIYSGNGMFVHSPTNGKAVTESSLDSGYFSKHFAGASRISRNGAAALSQAAGMVSYKDDVLAAKSNVPAQKSRVLVADTSGKQKPKAAKTATHKKKAKKLAKGTKKKAPLASKRITASRGAAGPAKGKTPPPGLRAARTL